MTLTNTQLILSEAEPLLSPAAEKVLFEALARAKSDVKTLDGIPEKSLNQYSQLWAARQRVRNITGKIVKANLPLVIRIAQRMECPGISQDQMVSEGLLKLLQCIDAFQVDRGFKFSTYLYRPLYRMYSRFMLKEAKRNAGRVDGDIIFRSQIVEDGPHEVDELMEVLESNAAGLNDPEMTAVLHTYGIGKLEPKTLKQLSKLMKVSEGRAKSVLAGAVEKLEAVLTHE